jgi:hypothetical protein
MYLFSRIVGKVGAEGYLRGFWGRFVSILADYCMAIQCFGYFGYTQKLFYFNNRSPLAFLGGDNNPKLISIYPQAPRKQALAPHPSIVTLSRDSTSTAVWSTQAVNSFTPCCKVCSISTCRLRTASRLQSTFDYKYIRRMTCKHNPQA